jgi:hypothetical protein
MVFKNDNSPTSADKTNQGCGHVFFQPKHTINQPNDIYEQEADAVADRVMRMPDPAVNDHVFFKPAQANIQRKCQHCEEGEKLHRKETSTAETPGSHELDSYVASLGSSGQALPDSSRQFFEPRFGHDFSNVRIHTDSVAAKSAQSINALAYTTGNNIVFNSGQYSAETDSGKRLIAHELTHVIQQGSDNSGKSVQTKSIAKDNDYTEQTAVNEKKMPAIIESIINASPLLKPYLEADAGKVDAKGKFKVKYGKANLLAAYRECYGADPETESIGGFYCRKDDTIYTVDGIGKEHTSTFGEAIHEGIHKKSKLSFSNKYTHYINEGLTQLFADKVLNEQELPDYKGHAYMDQLACAKNLVRVIGGIDEVAKEYFKGESNLLDVLNEKFSAELKAEHTNSVLTFVRNRKPSPQTFCKMLEKK